MSTTTRPTTTRRRWAPFLLLEGSTLLSGAGNGVATVALPWLVLERTGSAAAAGIVAAAAAIPLVLTSLLSGTVVDIVGRRRTAVVSDLLSAASVAAIPIVDATAGLTVASIAALAALGAVFDPAGVTARETMLPATAQATGLRLERANGLHEAVWGTAFLLGPGIGGVLIGLLGPVPTLWVTAGAFVLSSLLTVGLRVAGAGRPERHERPDGVVRGTLEGLRWVWHDRLLRTLAVISMLLVGLYLPVEGVLLPVHFQALATPERLGLVVMALSGGGVLGALAYGAWGTRWSRRWTYLVALLVTTLALLGMAFLPVYGLLVGFALLTGFAYGPVNPLTNYAMQTRTPERLRGRVIGTITSVTYAAGPVGYLVAGPLVQALGVRTSFLLLAAGLALVALAAFALPSLREFDDAPRHPPGRPPRVGQEPLPLSEQDVPCGVRDPT